MRKIFITLTTFFTLSLLLKIGLEIRHNLIYYSVYYAQNVHHNSNTDPVMATLIDNLSDIPKPENNQIGYDFDGIESATLIWTEFIRSEIIILLHRRV